MSTTSDRDLRKLVERFVHVSRLMSAAEKRVDIPTYNRLIVRNFAAGDEIERAGEAGRRALESLLDHEIAQVRLAAGQRVLRWDPAKAAPVLLRLMTNESLQGIHGYERISVSHSANMMLHLHFDVPVYDGTELIEPMRAYGIELSPEQVQAWRA